MKKHARKAYDELKSKGVHVIPPENGWGGHFAISTELYGDGSRGDEIEIGRSEGLFQRRFWDTSRGYATARSRPLRAALRRGPDQRARLHGDVGMGRQPARSYRHHQRDSAV